MKREFLCPHCQGQLNQITQENPDGFIRLLVQNRNHQKAIILVNPELGNYEVRVPDGFFWAKGEVLNIYCPLCSWSLLAYIGSTRSRLIIKEGEKKKTLIFSSIIGERLTYLIEEQKILAYGPDAKDEKDLWSQFTC